MATRAQWAAGSKLGERTFYPRSMDDMDRRSVIRLLSPENPKNIGYRPRERFQLYSDGMTVAEYISAVLDFGDSEQVALDDLAWDQNHLFIRVDAPASTQAWSVAEAKAKLSEILRLARAGEPQTIGSEEPCVVISADQFNQLWSPRHLGRFLLDSAPRGIELELPSRADHRGDPFAD
jgi:prevent-host-death family protein